MCILISCKLVPPCTEKKVQLELEHPASLTLILRTQMQERGLETPILFSKMISGGFHQNILKNILQIGALRGVHTLLVFFHSAVDIIHISRLA
jgi:hypothetical protein